jgi:hypothetical protein
VCPASGGGGGSDGCTPIFRHQCAPPTAPSCRAAPMHLPEHRPAQTRLRQHRPAPTRLRQHRLAATVAVHGAARRGNESWERAGAATGVHRWGVAGGKESAARNSRRLVRIGSGRDSDRASDAVVQGGAVDSGITIIPLVR